MPKLPRVTAEALIRALKRAGFAIRRQTGSHVVLRHPSTKRMAVVPRHAGTMPTGVVSSIVRQAGITSEQLQHLLKD